MQSAGTGAWATRPKVPVLPERLVAGAGGNISARDGKRIWMKPSGFAMDDMSPDDLCGMDLATGKQTQLTDGKGRYHSTRARM